MSKMARVTVALAALLLAACAPAPAPAPDASPAVESAPGPAAPTSYVQASAPAADGTVHLRVAAPPDRALYLDNCNGAFSWGLEHRVDGAWTPAWIPPINGCASPRLVFDAGRSRTLALRYLPGPGEAPLPAGTYRLALYGLHYARDFGDRTAEVPADRRASAPFEFDPGAPPR